MPEGVGHPDALVEGSRAGAERRDRFDPSRLVAFCAERAQSGPLRLAVWTKVHSH